MGYATEIVCDRRDAEFKPVRVDHVAFEIRIGDADRHDRGMELLIVVERDCDYRHAFLQSERTKSGSHVTGTRSGGVQSRGTEYSP